MTKLYFVRHGITKNNQLHTFNGGRSNPGLLPEGVEQARKLGNWLKKEAFSAIYVSPQKRALKTMEIIINESDFGHPLIFHDDLLKEIDFGEWDGMPVEKKRGHIQLDHLLHSPDEYDPNEFKGENYYDLVERGKKFLDKLTYTNEGSYLVVGHGVMLTSLVQIMNNRKISTIRDSGLLDNASVSIFETADGKSFYRSLWNYTDY